MHRAIKPGGKFFIEVRGVHDPLYGRGQPQEKNAFFYNNHYRRFIVMEELTASRRRRGSAWSTLRSGPASPPTEMMTRR